MKLRPVYLLIAATLSLLGCGAEPGNEPGNEPDLERVGTTHATAINQGLSLEAGSTATYDLPVPDGWTTETASLPPPWVPNFPFTGTEDIRFPPHWDDPTSNEWWSYVYLFWIDSGPAVTADLLRSALTDYYKGLMDCGNSPNCDPSRFAGQIRRIAQLGSISVFGGELDIMDLLGTPITLNLLITSFACPVSQHRGVLVSASPYPLSNVIWKTLLKEQLQFRCR